MSGVPRRRTVPRLKWHMLRRRKSDPPFQRKNLVAALQSDSACEVDVVFSSDGHALCLHDRTLDRETTGHGRVIETTRADIERLRQRGSDGSILDDAPLFLDEVVAIVDAIGTPTPALVQLDIKARESDVSSTALDQLATLLRGTADGFIASAYDWGVVKRIVGAVPGLHSGFDPLAFYPRSFQLDADGYRAVAARTRATAPDAAIYYLEARLILAALEHGVNLIERVGVAGARIDAWTIDADHPELERTLSELVEVGCHQITSNDPDHLALILDRLA